MRGTRRSEVGAVPGGLSLVVVMGAGARGGACPGAAAPVEQTPWAVTASGHNHRQGQRWLSVTRGACCKPPVGAALTGCLC